MNLSRSGYYKWRDRAPSEHEKATEELAEEIKRIYDESDSTYGVERVKLAIKREVGMTVNIKRVRRIMHILGISSVIRRKRPNYVKSTPEHTYENILKRDFVAHAPNQKWFTDVTYLKVASTNVYLSAIIDTYDQSIVAWKISRSNDNQLVKDTLEMAFETNPGAKPIIQADRGSQYTSGMYRKMALQYEFTASMSRVSRCLDNQPIESFWGTLKSEYYYRYKFENLNELKAGIASYIDRYMNKRYVKRLGGLTPVEFRSLAA